MLHREIIAVCSQIHTKHINTLCGQNVELLNVKLAVRIHVVIIRVNPLKPELNPICYLLALLGAHHFLHVNRIRVKSLTFRRLMSYIYIWSTHS